MIVPEAAIIDVITRARSDSRFLRPRAETLTGPLLAACPRGMGQVEMVGWRMWNA